MLPTGSRLWRRKTYFLREEKRKRGDKRKKKEKKEKKEEGMFLLYSSFSPIENTNIKHDLNNDINRHDMMEGGNSMGPYR